MESLIVVIPLLVVGLILQRRRRRGDGSSVDRHQRALQALVDIGARGPSSSALPEGDDHADADRYFKRVEVTPEEEKEERAQRTRRRAARPSWVAPPRRSEPHDSPTVVLPGASRGTGNPLMLHRPLMRARRRRPGRRVVLLALVVVFALVGAAVAWRAIDDDSGGSPTTERTEAPATTTPRPADTGAPERIAPVSSDATGASYEVELPTTISVSARDTCWLRVRQGTAGAAIFEGTLAKGQSRSFESSGPLTMRVGNPGAARVEVGGTPVELPSRGSTPYLLTFS